VSFSWRLSKSWTQVWSWAANCTTKEASRKTGSMMNPSSPRGNLMSQCVSVDPCLSMEVLCEELWSCCLHRRTCWGKSWHSCPYLFYPKASCLAWGDLRPFSSSLSVEHYFWMASSCSSWFSLKLLLSVTYRRSLCLTTYRLPSEPFLTLWRYFCTQLKYRFLGLTGQTEASSSV